jgi:hypothetical protein
MFYVHAIYTRPLSAQAQYSRSCHNICSLRCNSSLDTWTVVRLTAANFKPLMFQSVTFVTVCLCTDSTANTFLAAATLQSYNRRGWLHWKHGFLQFFYCCVNKCCYADVALRVPLLNHSLLCHGLLTNVSSGWTAPAFTERNTILKR